MSADVRPNVPAFGFEARDGDLIESQDEQLTIKRIAELATLHRPRVVNPGGDS
jgi:hypothetical protein